MLLKNMNFFERSMGLGKNGSDGRYHLNFVAFMATDGGIAPRRVPGSSATISARGARVAQRQDHQRLRVQPDRRS
jgi:hypothetical protein